MKANELSVGWALTQSDPAAALRRVFQNWSDYANRRNAFFSDIAGEDFTNRQVIAAHAIIPGLLLACTIAERLTAIV